MKKINKITFKDIVGLIAYLVFFPFTYLKQRLTLNSTREYFVPLDEADYRIFIPQTKASKEGLKDVARFLTEIADNWDEWEKQSGKTHIVANPGNQVELFYKSRFVRPYNNVIDEQGE